MLILMFNGTVCSYVYYVIFVCTYIESSDVRSVCMCVHTYIHLLPSSMSENSNQPYSRWWRLMRITS